MYARPKPHETDEDLLRMQDEFLRNKAENKIKLAATVVSEKKIEDNASTNPTQAEVKNTVFQMGDVFKFVPKRDDLKIVERFPDGSTRPVANPAHQFSTVRGFPIATRRDLNIKPVEGTSLFAQQFNKTKQPQAEPMQTDDSASCSVDEVKPISSVLSASDREQIHARNLQTLNRMSTEEILEEKERILTTMDPAIVAFLKARAKQQSNQKSAVKEQNVQAKREVNLDELETPKDILKQPLADKWLNFSNIETSKLEWMKGVKIPKIPKDQTYEARFDFEGFLMPYSQETIDEKSRILYHHGEEPGRPGYTLQELFQLSRSNVTQQKITGLNCIANILSLQSTGVYDDIIDIPLEQIFFVLRFCLDDNTPGVLNASIKAMRNLIYNKIDETCLDSLLGFGLGQIQPVLAIDNATEDDKTVNDQQLAESNLIRCLVRSDILTRIRYIITTVKPPIETIVYCVDILTRLARDSPFIMGKVYSYPNLMDNLLINFLPNTPNPTKTDTTYGVPLLQVVKLLRILSCRSKRIASDLVEKYKVFASLTTYISSDVFLGNVNGLRLQTECFHLWSVFVRYNLGWEHFPILVLMQQLDYHFKNTNLDMRSTFARQGHLSALLILIGTMVPYYSSVAFYLPLLHQCSVKWVKHFGILEKFTCGKLQIIASLFSTMISLRSLYEIPEIDDLTVELVHSKGFRTVTNTLKNGSMLLNNYQVHKSSANLKTLETAAWDTYEHVIPLIQSNSPIPFLSALSNFLQSTGDLRPKLVFLNHENIMDYVKRLSSAHQYYLTSHWFTRIESNLVLNILKCAVSVRTSLASTSSFYELAVKCLCIFNTEQKCDIEWVLVNIIFSTQFYPSDVLMRNLDISQRSDSLELSLNNLPEILTVYTQVLGLKTNLPDFSTNLCIDFSEGNVIPIDWIYTPVIVLYSNQQKNKQTLKEQDQVFIIRNCLRWILIYETYFPDLAATIDPTDRFCRLACVFLASDSLFLIDEVHNLLELCLRNIVAKCEDKIDFNREIQGLSNFQQFYIQLLEQYQAVSYGDVLFGNFILLPLAQRHAIDWRKTLWSEYAGVVEVFSVTPETCICSVESFLKPEEEDISLLKCYHRALSSGSIRQNSILHKIATHHVTAKRQREAEKKKSIQPPIL